MLRVAGCELGDASAAVQQCGSVAVTPLHTEHQGEMLKKSLILEETYSICSVVSWGNIETPKARIAHGA